ncbi:hypothetical protein MNV49_006590 [Pseudohyphozyma bogoriensis]|nr:hypothetical protein MNV49_006590 [Pseudohyphozyma bogoriensis]
MSVNTTEALAYTPLVPSLSYLSILLPPLAIALSLLLHTIYNSATPTTAHAHVYRAKTAHARFLPALAKHAFSYPVLFLGLDLEELEKGKLDDGRLFGWMPNRWTVTSLWPRAYLEPLKPGEGVTGIRERLWAHLARFGVGKEEAEKVYTVTMPAYLGFEGINPLTVHYCYRVTRTAGRDLSAVVLEVHNTFGERHLYVLRCGVDEDDKVAAGFEHQWTFPRAFHVSPFNDRSGFYRVSLSDPLASSPCPSSSSSLPLNPSLSIRIIFLTSSHQKKIYAALSGPGVPLTSSTLLSALLYTPFALLLTTPRILYQAMKLHYSKKLDVFPRPEPHVEGVVGDGEDENPVEKGGVGGGVGWQGVGGTEEEARRRVVRFLENRIGEMGREGRNVRVELRATDPAQPVLVFSSPDDTATSSSPSTLPPIETLAITYLTPLFFTDLLISPSIPLALSLGSHTLHRWKTTSDELFLDVFSPPSPTTTPPPLLTRFASHIRLSQLLWSLSFSPRPLSPFSSLSSLPPHHPLDDNSVSLVWTLLSYAVGIRAGYWVFVSSGARTERATKNMQLHGQPLKCIKIEYLQNETTLETLYRVSVSDGRTFVGSFVAVDQQGNLVLDRAVELSPSSREEGGEKGGDEREVGLVLLKKEHWVSVEREEKEEEKGGIGCLPV